MSGFVVFKPVILRVLLLVIGLVLSGCAQLKPKVESAFGLDAAQTQPESVSKPEDSQQSGKDVSKIELTAAEMYRVMLAEMLVVKGDVRTGFSVMHEVATLTRQPELAERAFKLSMATYDLASIASAAALWRDVSPDEPLAWKASYIMQARDGRIEEAISSWSRFQQLSGKDLVHVLMETGVRITQAVPVEHGTAFLQQLHQKYPQSLVMRYVLGMASEAYKQYALAIRQLESTIAQIDSETSNEMGAELRQQLYRESHYLLANAYLKSGQSELGLVRLADYIKAHPKDWKFQERYARMEVKVGRFDLAESRYLKVVENEPDANTSKLSAALLMLEREAYDKAEVLLIELESVLPYRSSALYYLGVSAQRQHQLTQAKRYFQQITTHDYLLDARLHMAEIDYPEVGLVKTLEALDAIDVTETADKVKLLQAKAIFYNKAGEKQKSIMVYDQAIALQDQKVELYLMQAMLFYDLAQFEQYEANLKQALAIDGDDVEIMNALGYFYAEQKREFVYAQQLLDKALTLAPNRYYILDSRGWLAYQQGQYQEAEKFLSRALALQVDEEVLIHLIHVLWKLERQEEAKKLWVDYRNQYPQNEVLQTLILDLMK
ncbi:lipopolysaccharide assembly protein LapB [Hydrogenovibrio sp. SC-1]|uniref:tetratricopeptide repeat protein n=1 Tax=Hydrogenovibrio sp. SC-1 TaxID=2065820 RepID=UPI00130405C8|nr:tetratricopeptide repeat protein [Hydrogenovibrio sp. SC-1]